MQFARKLLIKIENANFLYLTTILIFIALVVYGSSLFNSFVWDDEEQVLNNSIIQNLSNIPYLFTTSTFNTGGAGLSGLYYKPLMPLSFSLIYSVWNSNFFGFHLFGLTLHIINSTLIFFFLKKLFTFQKYFSFSKTLAFLLSVIFLIHPANTEAVVYVSSTQELLYTFFLLTSSFLVLNFIKKPKSSLKILLAINIFILLSLLSKESGVVTIPLIIVLTFIFSRSKTAIVSISSLSTFAFYLFLRFGVAKTPLFQHSSIIPIANSTFTERLQTIPFELFSYFRLIFFPKDLFIAQHTVIKNIGDPRFFISLSIVGIASIFIIFIILKFKSKINLFFVLWIIFSFSILLNIYALDMTIAERWLYAPLIAILGLLGNLFLNSKEKFKIYFLAALIILIPVFSYRTFVRTLDWRNNLTLFSHDIKYIEGSFDAQNNLGVAFFRNNQITEAKTHFEKSIELSPKWWTPYNNLGVIYQREGNAKKAKELYQLAIDNGNYYLAYENLASLRINTEKPADVIPFLKKSLQALPYNETLNKVAAFAYYKEGDFASAKLYAERTYSLNKSQENYQLLQMITNGK